MHKVGVATMIALAGLASATAQAACVAREDAETLATAALPTLLDSLGARCRTLGAPAASAARMAARVRADGSAAWPRARAIVGQVVPGAEMVGNLDEQQARELLTPVLTERLGEKMGVRECGLAEHALAAMAPLPARNVAQLVVTLVEADKARRAICPETAR